MANEYPTLQETHDHMLDTYDIDLTDSWVALKTELVRVGIIAEEDWPDID